MCPQATPPVASAQGEDEAGLAAAPQGSSVPGRQPPRSLTLQAGRSGRRPGRTGPAHLSAPRGLKRLQTEPSWRPGPPPAVSAQCLWLSLPKALWSSQRDLLFQLNLSFPPVFQLHWVGRTPWWGWSGPVVATDPLRPGWGSVKELQAGRDPVQGEQSRCEEGDWGGVPEAGGREGAVTGPHTSQVPEASS